MWQQALSDRHTLHTQIHSWKPCVGCVTAMCAHKRGMVREIIIKRMNRNVGLKTRWGEQEEEAVKEEEQTKSAG